MHPEMPRRSGLWPLKVLACFVLPISLSHPGWGAVLLATRTTAVAFALHADKVITSRVDPSALGQASVSRDSRIWACRAENATRLYEIKALKIGDQRFALKVFRVDDGRPSRRSHLLAEIPIKVGAWDRELHFVVKDGSDQLRVHAFGRTPAFSVESSGKTNEHAFGRCWL
jgi:hypothetical protein